jgi:hypothetical protein
MQQKWITKLIGYDFEIIFKKGHDNLVADALSRQQEESLTIMAISVLVNEWMNQLQ